MTESIASSRKSRPTLERVTRWIVNGTDIEIGDPVQWLNGIAIGIRAARVECAGKVLVFAFRPLTRDATATLSIVDMDEAILMVAEGYCCSIVPIHHQPST